MRLVVPIRVVLGLILLAVLLYAPQPSRFSMENAFVASWVAWKPLRENAELNPQVLDAKEVKAWDEVERQFDALRKYTRKRLK